MASNIYNDAHIAHTCNKCQKKKIIAMFLDDEEWYYFEDTIADCTCGGVFQCDEEGD